MKLIDLTGQQLGRWIVIERAPSRKRRDGTNRSYWLCRCTCVRATLKEVEAFALRSGISKSCGCLARERLYFGRPELIDLTGRRFGRLVVVGRAPDHKRANGQSRAHWLCRCTCPRGSLKEIEASALRSGSRKSCGCLHEGSPMLDRIIDNLVYDHGCWTWTAGITFEGYATSSAKGKRFYVHRVMYELDIGPIPEGLEIDHLCRNRACCNPLHLEAVTRAENIARGAAPAVMKEKAKRKTHCSHGHELYGDNLYVRPNGDRCCRACNATRGRKRYAVRAAARRLACQGTV